MMPLHAVFMRSCRAIILSFCMIFAMVVPTHAADQQCFPETNQCLNDRFLQFWNQNGGLAVFGYPLTPQQNEQSRDTGKTYPTQWLERNRLEAHADQLAPYDVLLGRLGDDRLHQLGRIWQSEPREIGPSLGCLWFAETGHNVCDQATGLGFRTYWETHGLQDPALNPYQRSLALFGLPLTQPQTETNSSGDTVLTQWFERARFEWHPDKPDMYRVLLGRLGDEVVHNGQPATPRPDGHIVYVSAADRIVGGDLYRMDTYGNQQTRLTSTHALTLEGSEYTVSPDGDRIAYRAGTELWVINSDGSGQRLIATNTIEPSPVSPQIFSPTWAPDGSHLAYVLDGDLYATRGDGSVASRITTGANVDQISCLSWAWNGYLAFRTPTLHTFKIMLVRSDGSDLHQVGQGLCPTLSPSGDRIVYLNGGDLWLMNADGSNGHALTSGHSFLPGQWSPDETRILTVAVNPSNRYDSDIFVIDAQTGATTQLTNDPDLDGMPAWSPDGTFITFASKRAKHYGVYIMHSDGSDQKLLQTPMESAAPQWLAR